MRGLLGSLRSLVFGETWTIPLGILLALAVTLLVRAVLPEELWDSAGGFVLAVLVCTTLAVALRLR
jgi:hypothetical protein